MRTALLFASVAACCGFAVPTRAADVEPPEGFGAQALSVPLDTEARDQGVHASRVKPRASHAFLELEPLFAVGGCVECKAPQAGVSVAAGWVPAPWLDLGLSFSRVAGLSNAELSLQKDESAWSFWALRGVVHPIPKGFIDPRFGVRLGAVTRDRSTARSVTGSTAVESIPSSYTTGSFLLGMDVRCLEWLKVGVEFERFFASPTGPAPLAAGLRIGVEY